jgi:hypothetical protein
LWTVPAPQPALALLSSILNHLGFQTAEAGMDLILNVAERRFRMRSSPFLHVGQDFFTQLSPAFFACLFHLPPSLSLMLLFYLFLFWLSTPFAKI